MNQIKTDFSDIKEFSENGDFVEYQGELYYIGQDPQALLDQGFELEESDMEITSYINTRRNVGSKHLKSEPYSFEIDPELYKEGKIKFDETRPYGAPDDILPDSDYIILKKLKHIPSNFPESKPDFVIWDENTKAYYVMSNTNTEFDVEPVKVKADYLVISADISAQEPMCSTLVTREPGWSQVFALKNFKYNQSETLQFLDMIAEDQLRIPTNDPNYMKFIHDSYFYDRTDLVKLNLLVFRCKLNNLPENRKNLEDHINKILQDFDSYVTKQKDAR